MGAGCVRRRAEPAWAYPSGLAWSRMLRSRINILRIEEAHDQAISDAANVADFVTDDLAEFLARLNSHLTD